MKRTIRYKSNSSTLQRFNALALAFVLGITVSPLARAVIPPPDGGYPGFNTAEGQNALFSLTTGVGNAAVGWFSLFSNTDGSFNTALGAGTLLSNVGNQSVSEGIKNTAIGTAALLFNTTGTDNTAVGTTALLNNTTGGVNTAVGSAALQNNMDGNFNTAVGKGALAANTTGDENTAIGEIALASSTASNFNTAVGSFALLSTTGEQNTAVGRGALGQNITGNNNTAIGDTALLSSTGSNNTALGKSAGGNVTTASNVICIGAFANGANVSNTCFIGNIRGVTTQNANAIPVLIDSAGQLGTVSSSRRFKTDIKLMDKASEAILALKPVSFRYKSHNDSTPQFGLIAEEVAEASPDLVVRDEKGEIYTVRYDAVNAMLLNEFLKEHKKVEQLERTVQDQEAILAQQQKSFESRLAAQDKQIEALTAGLQKVTDQIELSRPAPRVVLSNH